MTLETVIGQDGPDLAIEINLGGGRDGEEQEQRQQ
jgi:hypothetical protein